MEKSNFPGSHIIGKILFVIFISGYILLSWRTLVAMVVYKYILVYRLHLVTLGSISTLSPSWWWRWPLLRSLHQLPLRDQRVCPYGLRALLGNNYQYQLPMIRSQASAASTCHHYQVQVPRASTVIQLQCFCWINLMLSADQLWFSVAEFYLLRIKVFSSLDTHS